MKPSYDSINIYSHHDASSSSNYYQNSNFSDIDSRKHVYFGVSIRALSLILILAGVALLYNFSATSSGGIWLRRDELPVQLQLMPTFSLRRVGYGTVDINGSPIHYQVLASKVDIIEPHVPTELYMSLVSSLYYYEYMVCNTALNNCESGILSTDESAVTSTTISYNCTPFEELTLTVKEKYYSSDAVNNEESVPILCMYVRREIRDLTPDDLSATMDALYSVYSISDEIGQLTYGPEYHSNSFALRFHHFNAAQQESDHIHEGNGFMTQHIKMTNIIEKSMQLINPAVTLPYWDFTMDAALGHTVFSGQAIFTEDMFGETVSPYDIASGYQYRTDAIVNGVIKNGRWANLTAEKNDIYPSLKSGFGYLRAPWNMNPSPYVSRFPAEYQLGVFFPTCTTHYNMLTYDNLMELLYDMQNSPHATTHALIGGVYGCDKLESLLDAGYISDHESMLRICSNWIYFLKEFYRYNYITPYDNCEVASDVSASVCGFTCNTDADSMAGLLSNLQQKLINYVPSSMTDSGWDAWIEFICVGDAWKIFSGDHLESASPADPSFWVIHPTLERLLHAKLMAGGLTSETWNSNVYSETVCDKSQCYDSFTDTVDYHDTCCYGHFENDQTLDFVTGDKAQYYGATNGETLAATDPRLATYSMPYIYDKFNWDHCENDFPGLLTSLQNGTIDKVSTKTVMLPSIDSQPGKIGGGGRGGGVGVGTAVGGGGGQRQRGLRTTTKHL